MKHGPKRPFGGGGSREAARWRGVGSAIVAPLLLGGCFLFGEAPSEEAPECPAGTIEVDGACEQICDPATELPEGDGCVACDPSCEGKRCGELSGCRTACDGACFVWTKFEPVAAARPQGRGRACFVHLPDAEGGSFLLAGGWHRDRQQDRGGDRNYLQAEGTWVLEGRLPAEASWRRLDDAQLVGADDPAELPLRDATCARLPDGRVVAFGQAERGEVGELVGDPPAKVYLWEGGAFRLADAPSQQGAPRRSGGTLVVGELGSVDWWFGCGPDQRSTGEICSWREGEGFSCRPGPVFEREIEVEGGTEIVRLRGASVARDRSSDKLLVQGGAYRFDSSCSTGTDWIHGGELNGTAWLVAADGTYEALAAGPTPRDAQRAVAGPAGVVVAGGADASASPTQFPEQTCSFDEQTWRCHNDCQNTDEDVDGEREWSCRPATDPCNGTPAANAACGFPTFGDPSLAANDEAYVLLAGWYDDASPYAGWVYMRRDRLVTPGP